MADSPEPERHHALQQVSPGRTLAFSAVVGLLSGLTAVLFRLLVEQTEAGRARLCEVLREGQNLPTLLVFVALCGALGASAAWLTQRFCPRAAHAP